MKPISILQEFEQIAEELGIRIIHGKGNCHGGYCILENESIIVVNKLKPIEQRIRTLIQVFAKLDTVEMLCLTP